MRLLTYKQKNWLTRRRVEVGRLYMFPRNGFNVYAKPDLETGEYIDTNPFTRSLDHEYFEVKEIVNGFCRGNFHHRPKQPDFYLTVSELSARGLTEIFLLFTLCSVPMLLYNLCRGGVSKIESKQNAQT